MRKWVRPSACEECFASNKSIADSVSACFSVYCMVAGDGKGGFKENTYGSGKSISWGIYQNDDYVTDTNQHGKPCAAGSSYNTATGKFYEYGKNIQAEIFKSIITSEMLQMVIKLHGNQKKAQQNTCTMVMPLMISQINLTIHKTFNTEQLCSVFFYPYIYTFIF